MAKEKIDGTLREALEKIKIEYDASNLTNVRRTELAHELYELMSQYGKRRTFGKSGME